MTKPSDCISVTEAKALQANWMDSHEPSASSLGGEALKVCSVTFDIDQLQEYLTYVKAESKSQGILKPGIRVYFAAYNSGIDAEAAGSTTVFFCPSESDSGNSANNYNIDALNKGQNGWPPGAY
ncbi:MAG: hypothetical protein JKY22_09245 [Flavobacteriaceae bacterium]|nr:hypothetical protein [Flavobacteriaceae bacterium]